ncbi:MAG TPA: VanZ family protein [Thermoanaerobaculia bacterium]|nr:VanZ family protein [Thermoanaerobaculia bacterium]
MTVSRIDRGSMGGALLYAAMSLLRRWLPVVVWAAVILSASNDSFSSGESARILAELLGDPVPYALNVAIRKLGHVVAYGILGALAWRADRRVKVAFAIGLLIAALDEGKQAMTLRRTGTLWDVLLDLFGAWLGVIAAKRVGKPASD